LGKAYTYLSSDRVPSGVKDQAGCSVGLTPTMPEEKKAHPGFYEYVPEEAPQPRKVVSPRLEFECLPSTETQFETSLDTFNRLKNEVLSLRDDLEQQKADPYAAPKLGLDHMAVTIHTLSGGPTADSGAMAVVGQVESCKPTATGNGITYSMYLNSSEQSPLLELDRRVDRLCQVVGGSEVTPAPGQSMFALVRDLQARLELADEFKLDAIYRRTKSLVTEIDTIETPEQSAAVQGQDQAKALQIAKLRGTLVPLSSAAQDVPNVLNRIKTRKDTDEQAAQVLLRLKRLQSSHEAVSRMLLTDQQAILKVGNQMVANSKIMTGNLQILQQRLKALS